MDSEWGPWVEHDGRGCPCAGKWVEGERRDGSVEQWLAHSSGDPSLGDLWIWGSSGPEWECEEVIRYRIKTPRALLQLREIANLKREPA